LRRQLSFLDQPTVWRSQLRCRVRLQRRGRCGRIDAAGGKLKSKGPAEDLGGPFA